MLENLPCAPRERCLTVTGLPGNVLPFFASVLGEWGYEIQHHPDGLVLTKAGQERAGETPPFAALDVATPLDLPTLWSLIESRFHATPRRHMRLKCDIPADLALTGAQSQSRFISLSDAGGRVLFPHELVRGESGRVLFSMGEQRFDTPCEVIYVLAKRAWEGSRGVETGIIFRWPDPQYLRQARQCIIRSYLDRVAAGLTEEEYVTGLEFFDRQQVGAGRR